MCIVEKEKSELSTTEQLLLTLKRNGCQQTITKTNKFSNVMLIFKVCNTKH